MPLVFILLSSRVATGGMAEVYVGRHITPEGAFGPMVAVKRLLPHLVKDTSIVRMFLNEARITAQIDHPNVVRIFELGQVNGEPFIAMELLEGRTYADLRARAAEDGKRMPLGIAMSILAQACRGLGAAHKAVGEDGQSLALVHRDFTPDNIHVGVKGDVKVIDFGIAKTASWGSGTEPGTLKGKFFYMSPEMILGKEVDNRADLFAAGVMLYEQLCGRRPFTGNSVDEVVMKIAEGKLQPPSAFDPSVPRELQSVCLTALNRNPDSRFPSLEVFVDAMEALGGESSLASNSDVGTYVSSLFPEQTDDRRSSIRRAREADPSVPAAPIEEVHKGRHNLTTVSPARKQAASAATELAPVFVPTAPVEQAPAPVAAKPPVVEEKSSKKTPLIIAAVIGALGLAAFAVLGRPSHSPADVLAAADAAGDPVAKGKLLRSLSKSSDATDVQLAHAADVLATARQWDVGVEFTEPWLQREPKNVDALLLFAKSNLALKRGKKAEAALETAIQSAAKDDPRPELFLADMREAQGDARGVVEALSKASAKTPDDVHLVVRRGYWLSQLGKLDEAEDVLRGVIKKQYDAEAAAELGFVKYRQEKHDEALKLLQKAVKEKPDLMIGHYYLATVQYQKGEIKTARAEYLEADKLAGADTRPLVALCELEGQQGSTTEMDDVKKKLKERFPADADAIISKCSK